MLHQIVSPRLAWRLDEASEDLLPAVRGPTTQVLTQACLAAQLYTSVAEAAGGERGSREMEYRIF